MKLRKLSQINKSKERTDLFVTPHMLIKVSVEKTTDLLSNAELNCTPSGPWSMTLTKIWSRSITWLFSRLTGNFLHQQQGQHQDQGLPAANTVDNDEGATNTALERFKCDEDVEDIQHKARDEVRHDWISRSFNSPPCSAMNSAGFSHSHQLLSQG